MTRRRKCVVVTGCIAWWLVAVALPAGAMPIDLADPGPYGAGFTNVTVPRPGGGSFSATLYYPATSNGSGAPFNPAGGSYPGIAFGHGFLQQVDKYQSTLEHLASWGYFVVAPNTQTGLLPNHSDFATDLRQSLDYLTTQNATPASPYFHRVNTEAYGLSGHSMGGGASVLAAAADTRLKAVMTMAAANTNPSAINAMPSVTAPIAFLAGEDDNIAPVANHQQPMYANGGPPKLIEILAGGSHCRFEDTDFIFCDGSTLSRPDQLAITRRELTTYFNFYLKRDESLWRQVWGPEAFADPQIATQAASGIQLLPWAGAQSVLPGQTVNYQVTLTNQGRQATSFDLFAEDQSWATVISPATSPVLAPGQSTTVNVAVMAPWGTFGATDNLLLSARSGVDGLTRGFTQLTTTTPAFDAEVALASLGNARALKFSDEGAGGVFADASDGLLTPLAVTYDPAGNLYVADVLRSRVVRFDTSGVGSVFADATDGLASPSGLARDAAGNLFVTNYLTNTIVKVAPNGVGTVFADAADGLNSPFGLAFDATGNLYVANLGDREVLRFDSAGNVNVFADAADGLLTPFGLAVDHLGNVYVSDVLRSRVTRFDPAGTGGVFADLADGLTSPAGLAFDAIDQLYVSNYLSNTVVRVSPSGVGTLFADVADGLNSPFSAAVRLLSGGGGAALASTAVPEPDTWTLAWMGAAALGWTIRRGCRG